MFDNYQEQQAMEPQKALPYSFATVGAVYEDGLSLIWPGETEPTQKHYKCNEVCMFIPGARVFVAKDGGSYIVLFPVGNPGEGCAAAVENQNKRFRGIELKMDYTNELQYRMRGSDWHKLSNK